MRIEEARQKHKAQPGSLPADRLLHKMDEKAMKQRMMQFRTAHAIAKKGRPFSDFVWQCNLDEAKGLDVGNLYRNRKQAHTFIHHIAEAQREQDLKTLKTAKFISLILDGTTDRSVIEKEIVYC